MTEKYELTEAQENRFAELEGIIERGQKSFLEVGAALIEIKNSKLYQNTHGTFEAYCKDRWGLVRKSAIDLSNFSVSTPLVEGSFTIIAALRYCQRLIFGSSK